MSAPGRRLAGLVVGLLGTFALVALSRVPYTIEPGADAMIRLSWRTATAFVEECRTVGAEELARMPVHMRRETICEGRLLPYRLQVVHEGVTVIDELVHGSGARRDRPLSVFRELRVMPGRHHVIVRWLPVGDAVSAAPALELESTLELEPLDVALITYDGNARRLVVRGRGE
jgi:hypothetical protein